MQEIGYGRMEDLMVRDGDPVLDPPPRIIRDYKFGGKSNGASRPKGRDFVLKRQHNELLGVLADTRNGRIRNLEIHNGLPLKMSLEDHAA